MVTWYFPPVNTIGAVRLGKFARFLQEAGHDIGVVAGKDWGYSETLPLEAPVERIAYVPAFDVNAVPSAVAGALKRLVRRGAPARSPALEPAPTQAGAGPGDGAASPHPLSRFYAELTNIPDNRVGWLNSATRAGIELCPDWRPELIFASGPPFTTFLIARRLSRRLGVPWVAELRDRWADDPYDTSPRWRRAINDWLERRVLASARALVTVTEPWAEFYRAKYAKLVATIYNGYDPADLVDLNGGAPSLVLAPDRLVIGYTGSIYPGRRDPTPLFEALRLLGEIGDRFLVVFCGTDPAHVLPLAERAGVLHLVEIRPAVPYRESLAFQQQSDVLLLMQWNDPREQGNCPGKFFEYIASLRPLLILGLDNGVPATIARSRGAGDCINDPPRIAAKLKEWLAEKDKFGRVPGLPEAAREGLSRDIQFAKLERFLVEIPVRSARPS